MSDTPTARDMIELPGPFLFKIVVKPDLVTEAALLDITRQSLGRNMHHQITHRLSKGGKYIAYSLTLHIEVYEEIEALYQAYGEQAGILWVL